MVKVSDIEKTEFVESCIYNELHKIIETHGFSILSPHACLTLDFKPFKTISGIFYICAWPRKKSIIISYMQSLGCLRDNDTDLIPLETYNYRQKFYVYKTSLEHLDELVGFFLLKGYKFNAK